ncbi:MAG: hypothetical protein NVS3B17_17000 [Vulcanimicrobiaceae bacterium]
MSPIFTFDDDTSPTTWTGTAVPPGTNTTVEAILADDGLAGVTEAAPCEEAASATVGVSNAKSAAIVKTLRVDTSF